MKGDLVFKITLPQLEPHDDPRAACLRVLKAAVEMLEGSHPTRGLPLTGTLRDAGGYCGMYEAGFEE